MTPATLEQAPTIKELRDLALQFPTQFATVREPRKFYKLEFDDYIRGILPPAKFDYQFSVHEYVLKAEKDLMLSSGSDCFLWIMKTN